MSVFSAKTGLSSILKSYSSSERDKAKNAIINKVRFEMPKRKGLLEVVSGVCEQDNYSALNEYVSYLKETEVNDEELARILKDARTVCNQLSPKFTNLVETLLCMNWSKRSAEVVHAYSEFFIDIMVAHNKYVQFGIPKLISLWIPNAGEEQLWLNGKPSAEISNELLAIHKLLERLLNAVPMTFDVVMQTIEDKFPYYKKCSYIVAGYVHNVLCLLSYKPIFTEFALHMLLKRMVILDVNAPRSEIEEADCDEEEQDDEEFNDNDMDDDEQHIFEMDDCNNKAEEKNEQHSSMNHPIAETLDICMQQLFEFFTTKNPNAAELSEEQKLQKQNNAFKFMKILLKSFDNVILPSHNTHHVQFLMFYYCSFRPSLSEMFLQSLWEKVRNPNVSAVIRQAAVGYISSFLARAKFLNLSVLKHYLQELCSWANQYIQSSDQCRNVGSLKANLVFFSVCQAIFYVIAFRSCDLTGDKQSLLFLQRLQLSALVSCNFNPLRVCLPPVATAFAGVTRAYQLAYCHAILERNARRKLATVYANDVATPEATLDTFFPFDPYLLKLSAAHISSIYLQYKANEAEEHQENSSCSETLSSKLMHRKRGDSEMLDDFDVDDFIIADKRQKCSADLAREAQFSYGLSPGFHT